MYSRIMKALINPKILGAAASVATVAVSAKVISEYEDHQTRDVHPMVFSDFHEPSVIAHEQPVSPSARR